MKIAIVSDIHGNFGAFKKFMDIIADEDIEKILNLGDFVRGKDQHKIIELIMSDERFISIKGNHEYGYCNENKNDESDNYKKYIEWINNQEDQRIVEIEGLKILMTHSRIASNNLPPLLYKGGTLNEFMADYPDDVDLICFGHTHIQVFIENFYGKKILNPGSIGAALDKKSNFAIVDINKDGISYKFIKEEYSK
jgi:putative phosphoesterase